MVRLAPVFALCVWVACAAPTVGRLSTDDAGIPAASARCESQERPPAGTCVAWVEGIVQDEEGHSLSTAHVSVCSVSLCIPGLVDNTGRFTADVGRWIQPEDFVVHVDGRPTHADTFVRLPLPAGGIVQLGMLRTLTLSNASDILHSRRAQSLHAGGITLTVPEAATVSFALADADDASRTFRVGRAPRGEALEIAFGPFGATFDVPSVVTVALGPEASGQHFDVGLLEDDVTTQKAGTQTHVGTFVATAAGDLNVPISRLTVLTLTKK